jgi:hypothetical protein
MPFERGEAPAGFDADVPVGHEDPDGRQQTQRSSALYRHYPLAVPLLLKSRELVLALGGKLAAGKGALSDSAQAAGRFTASLRRMALGSGDGRGLWPSLYGPDSAPGHSAPEAQMDQE